MTVATTRRAPIIADQLKARHVALRFHPACSKSNPAAWNSVLIGCWSVSMGGWILDTDLFRSFLNLPPTYAR